MGKVGIRFGTPNGKRYEMECDENTTLESLNEAIAKGLASSKAPSGYYLRGWKLDMTKPLKSLDIGSDLVVPVVVTRAPVRVPPITAISQPRRPGAIFGPGGGLEVLGRLGLLGQGAGGAGGVPAPAPQGPLSPQQQGEIRYLMDMGFGEADARRAYDRAGRDLQLAAELLVGG